MSITVSDIMKLTTYDIRIEKRNEKGQLVNIDLDSFKSQEVKRIRPSSQGVLVIEI